MTTDTLSAEVLDEAEDIVRAEWLRLFAAIPQTCTAARTEMPVARPRLRTLAAVRPARRGWPEPVLLRCGCEPRQRSGTVWPTQRSPPRPR